LIAWASVEGADIKNCGSVCFKADTIAKLFGEAPKQQIGDDLHRFKTLMETGEIATNEGQPSGTTF
jgi:uncharacterized membrane protein